MRELEAPTDWNSLPIRVPRAGQCGNATFHWSNCIHRDPAWAKTESRERVTVHFAFGPLDSGGKLSADLVFNEHWCNELKDHPGGERDPAPPEHVQRLDSGPARKKRIGRRLADIRTV
jgi:hypothetical protein